MDAYLNEPGGTERTRLRRLAEKAVADRGVLHAVLDAGRIAHVAIVQEGQPYALPTAYARIGDAVVLHGSTGSRLFRALVAGTPACVTVTVLDGLILARSAFEASMRYRCAMVLGSAAPLEGEEKLAALRAISEQLVPGRWAELRPPSKKELAATLAVALPLAECSVKVSAGFPTDAEEDLDLPVWAGVLPIAEATGEPIPDPLLRPGIPVPPYLSRVAP
jgi:nitroimidazol reductase NimA-like FMN-containing flavoprotein (pyridoxamine 5'-phosphate oxidase superfamily)